MGNENVLLEVNHPYSYRLGEDVYLTGYDVTKGTESNYCILQVVKHPWNDVYKRQIMYTNKQIWSVSYPILLSLLAKNVINVTDTAFLGHVSEGALGASAMGLSLIHIAAKTPISLKKQKTRRWKTQNR